MNMIFKLCVLYSYNSHPPPLENLITWIFFSFSLSISLFQTVVSLSSDIPILDLRIFFFLFSTQRESIYCLLSNSRNRFELNRSRNKHCARIMYLSLNKRIEKCARVPWNRRKKKKKKKKEKLEFHYHRKFSSRPRKISEWVKRRRRRRRRKRFFYPPMIFPLNLVFKFFFFSRFKIDRFFF